MYPYIDLSRLLGYPPCAIHVATQEQADAVIHNAREQFPERISDSWDTTNNYFRDYGEETGYTLYFEGDDEPTTLSYANIPFFEENDYVIIECEELLADSVDLTEGDQSLDVLLGGVV